MKLLPIYKTPFVLTLACVFSVVLLLFCLCYPLFQDWWYEATYQSLAERELGLSLEVINYQPCAACKPESALIIKSVVPGGVADKAGICAGDIPLSLSGHGMFVTTGQFCYRWRNFPASFYEVPVFNIADGPLYPITYGDGKITIKRLPKGT